jgi:hypothetical protein
MKMNGLMLGLAMMCVMGAATAADKKVQPKWEIKTRTLLHAEGYPDSRKTWGLGEWVELKVVPATISNVEWVVEGDAIVSNRFGNPSILVVQGGGKSSLSAIVHDEPQAASQAPPTSPPQDKWQRLAAELPVLEKMADKPADFEAYCTKVHQSLYPKLELSSIQAADMAFFIRLLQGTDRLSLISPGSFYWAEIRGVVADAAGMRLAVCLDNTADKTKLGGEFWDLLRACVANMESLKKQLTSAVAEFNGITDPLEKEKNGRNAAATTLRNHLSTLPFLLYVQLRNALPHASGSELKAALQEHGFSKGEITILLNAAK